MRETARKLGLIAFSICISSCNSSPFLPLEQDGSGLVFNMVLTPDSAFSFTLSRYTGNEDYFDSTLATVLSQGSLFVRPLNTSSHIQLTYVPRSTASIPYVPISANGRFLRRGEIYFRSTTANTVQEGQSYEFYVDNTITKERVTTTVPIRPHVTRKAIYSKIKRVTLPVLNPEGLEFWEEHAELDFIKPVEPSYFYVTLAFHVEIRDGNSANNSREYYAISLSGERFGINMPRDIRFFRFDPVTENQYVNPEYPYESFGFTGAAIPGDTVKLKMRYIQVYKSESDLTPNDVPPTTTFFVYRIDESFYRFLTTSLLQHNRGALPYAEPTVVFSSFKESQGVFGAATTISVLPMSEYIASIRGISWPLK